MNIRASPWQQRSPQLVVVSVLTLLVPLIVPLPVMVLGLFASSIQALIFSTLSAAYIGEAMEGH